LKKLPIVNKFIIPEENESLKISLKSITSLIAESVNLEENIEEVLNYISKDHDYVERSTLCEKITSP
jgi:hypothetical protein